jgi:hypothetical protein
LVVDTVAEVKLFVLLSKVVLQIESKLKDWHFYLVPKIAKGLIDEMGRDCFFTGLIQTPLPQVFSVIKTNKKAPQN